jgi:hypothetical protein
MKFNEGVLSMSTVRLIHRGIGPNLLSRLTTQLPQKYFHSSTPSSFACWVETPEENAQRITKRITNLEKANKALEIQLCEARSLLAKLYQNYIGYAKTGFFNSPNGAQWQLSERENIAIATQIKLHKAHRLNEHESLIEKLDLQIKHLEKQATFLQNNQKQLDQTEKAITELKSKQTQLSSMDPQKSNFLDPERSNEINKKAEEEFHRAAFKF